MRAAVVDGASSGIEIRDVPPPSLSSPTDVILRVLATGLCGSDLHIVAGEYQPIVYPMIPGHEFVGVVEELGGAVTTLAVGDRVAVDPSLYCGSCPYCRSGRDNLCEDGGGLGSTRPGSLAELVTVPEAQCHRVPATVPTELATLAEPLACVVHGFDRLGAIVGARVLVVGAGAVGTLAAWYASHLGAHHVAVYDRNADRAAQALRCGADAVLDNLGSGGTWDIVLECTGSKSAGEAAFQVIARGGTFVQMGVTAPGDTMSIRPFDIYRNEITIVGSRAILRSFSRARALLEKGADDLKNISFARYALEEIDQALESVRHGSAVKTIVNTSAVV